MDVPLTQAELSVLFDAVYQRDMKRLRKEREYLLGQLGQADEHLQDMKWRTRLGNHS